MTKKLVIKLYINRLTFNHGNIYDYCCIIRRAGATKMYLQSYSVFRVGGDREGSNVFKIIGAQVQNHNKVCLASTGR
jgi:hypothetical protein